MPVTKWNQPENNTPPHKGTEKKNKQTLQIEDQCSDDKFHICNETIKEESKYQSGEAIFCEGLCQGWLHRKCVQI